MHSDIAPDVTPFVVAFVILDVLAVIALVGVMVDASVTFFLRHRAIRRGLSERLLPYYRRVAAGQ